jgi:hypothetical protein
MTNYHHNLIHGVCGLLILTMFYLLCEPKTDVKTVDKTLYDAKLKEIDKAKNERDSVAVLLGRAAFKIDSIEKRPIQRELIYLTRTDEINLLTARDMADSVHDILADERARFERP